MTTLVVTRSRSVVIRASMSRCILWSFFGLELKNLASVDNTRVISVANNSFSFWFWLSSSQILGARRRIVHLSTYLAVWMDHVPWTLVHRRGVHRLLRVAADSLEVQLLHLLQLHLVCRASCWVPRVTTYLIKWLDVPLRVFKELVNIFAKHLLEISILHNTFSSTALRWCLNHRPAICLATIWLSTNSPSTTATSLWFWNLWKSVIWIKTVSNTH